METKYVKVPFEVELAKKITDKSVEGRIVTRDGRSVRVVCWDYKSMSGNYPIFALIDENVQEQSYTFSENGKFNIFGYESENNSDLMLEIPEYMTYKDGDVLCCKGAYSWIFIYRSDGGDITSCYAAMMENSSDTFWGLCIMSDDEVKDLRHATEEEKQKLIDALKASEEPKAKEYLKRFFGIEQKEEYRLKPFDKVLVRDCDGSEWCANIYSHKDNRETLPYRCLDDWYRFCIPYNDQTAHLLGTTDNWEE